MGFGTLFIGYFFLVNISYFAYTDIIASMIILMGAWRLFPINRNFKLAFYAASAFGLISLAEIMISIYTLFFPGASFGGYLAYLSSPRHLIIGVFTLFLLTAIADVAKEVDARPLAARARVSVPFVIIYAAMAIFDIPGLFSNQSNALGYIYFALIIFLLAYITCNLITIYRAYMQICMPGDLKDENKKSRFGFINKFNEYEAGKAREYAEYKLNRQIEKSKKKNNKKK